MAMRRMLIGKVNRMVPETVRKLKGTHGFTLAETLLAVLILMLVSVIVANGMPAARDAYEKVVIGANAKTMLSTAVTALHDEFATAWKVEEERAGGAGGVVTALTYFNASTGAKSRITLVTVDPDDDNPDNDYPAIQVQDYVAMADDLIHTTPPTEETPKEGTVRHLIPDKSMSLYVTYTDIGYADGVVTVSGLKVCRQSDNKTLAVLTGNEGNLNLTIRVISDSAA